MNISFQQIGILLIVIAIILGTVVKLCMNNPDNSNEVMSAGCIIFVIIPTMIITGIHLILKY